MADLVSFAQSGLLLAVAICLPLLVVTAAVGLVMAVLQAATQIQDSALSHLPRLLAAAAVLTLLGPWMGRQVVALALRAFQMR